MRLTHEIAQKLKMFQFLLGKVRQLELACGNDTSTLSIVSIPFR